MSLEPNALLDAVGRRRLVFAATAGRTGTAYVTELFKGLGDTLAVHEPEPNFLHAMRRSQEHPPLALDFLLRHKLPFIAAQPQTAYVETSHLACKGFLEPMLSLGLRPGLLLLRRAPRAVARSLLERATVPGRTAAGWMYLLQPGDPGTLPFPGHATASDYQLCFWYALEIERRQARYATWFERLGCPVVDATAAELHDVGAWRRTVDALGLGDRLDEGAFAEHHCRVTEQAWNKNTKTLAPPPEQERQEDAVWRAVQPFEPILRLELATRYGA